MARTRCSGIVAAAPRARIFISGSRASRGVSERSWYRVYVGVCLRGSGAKYALERRRKVGDALSSMIGDSAQQNQTTLRRVKAGDGAQARGAAASNTLACACRDKYLLLAYALWRIKSD